jgi:alpha-L-rhamnosidase
MSMIPVKLRTEARMNPVGIDTLLPVFSWQMHSTEKNVLQKAYEIVVYHENTIAWQSGKVYSDEVMSTYAGEPLLARTSYQWTVTLWDNNGNSVKSEPASFEMGIFECDWTARWIEPEQLDATPDPVDSRKFHKNIECIKKGIKPEPSDYSKLRPAQYIRRRFTVKCSIKRARAYATAHGVYRLELNGERVGNTELAPDFTSYPQFLQYQTYDITDNLREGENVIGAVVADGWYISRMGNTGQSCGYGNRLAFLMQLEIEYEDGTMEAVMTDESFKSSVGPLIYSDLTIGERYDAQKELIGWSTVDYDDENWNQCMIKEISHKNIAAQCSAPVTVTDRIKAVKAFTAPNGEKVVDFGQVIAGRIHMKVKGKPGDLIKVEHYETLGPDGNVRWNITGPNKDQTLFYICKSSEAEEYEPQFTFMGFRYIVVEGAEEEINAENFTAVVISSIHLYDDVFTCSDERLNRLQQNILWSQKANMLSIPTDCPQREKMGWTGDIQVYIKTACINADMQSFINRWLRNVRLEQGKKGEIGFFVPSPYFYLEDGFHASAGWGDAAVIVPYTLYRVYRDRRILEDNYIMMKKWMEYIESAANSCISGDLEDRTGEAALDRQKYIWDTGFQWGDWAAPSDVDVNPAAMSPEEIRKYAGVAATCFYAYSAELLSKMANILGKEEDEEYYKELTLKIRNAFTSEFVDNEGRLQGNRQGNYVLALQMKTIPGEMRPGLARHLSDLIKDNGYRLDTGFLSTPFLLDILMEYGYKEAAYKVLFQTQCPSWLYEVEHGATTIWEKWNAIEPDGNVGTCDLNHYSFGCVGDFIFRRIAGINMTEPGYKKSFIAPDFDCGLTFARGKTETIYGGMSCLWETDGSKAVIDVVIPPNTTSTIVLPGARLQDISELPATQHGNNVHVEVGSGLYHFEYLINRSK